MPDTSHLIDDLLDPISAAQPAGSDLRWTLEWDRIKEARRADDDLESGPWTKRERKVADWQAVVELASAMLRERTKDLQLAMWFTEAGLKLHGFSGLRDGLRLTRELIVRYWDSGLYPAMEDGPEDRSGPLEWLNSKLVDSIAAIPITARGDQGRDYSYTDLMDARHIGSEAGCRGPDGEFDPKKKREFDDALASGHISTEMFERALKESSCARYEELAGQFQEAYAEFKELEKTIEEKFGDAAPSLSDCRTALNNIRQHISDTLDAKQRSEAGTRPEPANPSNPSNPAAPVVVRFPLQVPAIQTSAGASSGSWHEAEMLVRAGEVEQGLAEMTRLAAAETSGRSRFQRKLVLAEVCLGSKRERLARSILEELAEQIDKFQLESWESSELISGVWTRLYRIYRQGADSSDQDRAQKLYERLARLDPWQALACGEV
jgi:type VI secretion system protein ImpA